MLPEYCPRVKVTGLPGHPELNGRHGVALSFVQETGCFEIFLPGKGSLAVLPENLQLPRWKVTDNSNAGKTVKDCLDSKCRITTVDGKGAGIIAIAGIRAGECVLAEKPILLRPESKSLATYESEIASLPDYERDAFWALHDAHAKDKIKTIRGIVKTNGLELEKNFGGICLNASNFNHSCRPNVVHTWVESRQLMVFNAASDIQPGEELCIAYCDPSMAFPERQEKLAKAFNFTCVCEDCSLTGPRRQKSDEVSGELNHLYDSLRKNDMSCNSAPMMLEQVLQIIQDEYRGHPGMLMSTYYVGFQVGLRSKDFNLARSMMYGAYRYRCIAEGDHAGTREWFSYGIDPSAHKCPCGSGLRHKYCCNAPHLMQMMLRAIPFIIPVLIFLLAGVLKAVIPPIFT